MEVTVHPFGYEDNMGGRLAVRITVRPPKNLQRMSSNQLFGSVNFMAVLEWRTSIWGLENTDCQLSQCVSARERQFVKRPLQSKTNM